MKEQIIQLLQLKGFEIIDRNPDVCAAKTNESGDTVHLIYDGRNNNVSAQVINQKRLYLDVFTGIELRTIEDLEYLVSCTHFLKEYFD